jgi:hypothetical protein
MTVTRLFVQPRLAMLLVVAVIVALSAALRDCAAMEPQAAYQLRLDEGHPWRPPFGLDRIGRPIAAVVEITTRPKAGIYILEAFSQRMPVARQTVRFAASPPYSARVELGGVATVDELVLSAAEGESAATAVVARQAVRVAEFEAAAFARPDSTVNPVDLGTILVPAGWLLLGPGQAATLEVAALCRTRDLHAAKLTVSFESAPAAATVRTLSLQASVNARLSVKVPVTPPAGEFDRLVVVIDDGSGALLWRQSISVMLVRHPPPSSRFGATYERLRYDAPVSVREPGTGKYSTMAYDTAWAPELRDVVVRLPNGGRFVFWRGSSYIPFWAGNHNTGACYEWAEIISQPKGAVDCVEPLMDKQLRYGRVAIVESTSARVHVRWTYQSTDFDYKVWGDLVVEDYFFYPDGFGTRVVNLKSDPKNDYELSEFIILSAQGSFPFEVLPDDPVDALYLDGRARRFRFPNPTADDPSASDRDNGKVPVLFRLRFGKDERLSAVYFNPGENRLPGVIFAPFFDAGQMVTPCYWGSHWPLARGNSTGQTIDDRIALTPTHNSVMSWAGRRPTPLATSERVTLDTLGRSRLMIERRWAWLIGASDASDPRLVAWAKSFSTPPSLDLRGAQGDSAGYLIERRAFRLEPQASDIQIMIKPTVPCVNPVFEFTRKIAGDLRLTLASRPLAEERYAWDGQTLWVDATIEAPTELRLMFGTSVPGRLP